MRRDHRPYWMRALHERFERWQTSRLIVPFLDACGPGLRVTRPNHVHLFGADIRLGAQVEIRPTREAPVRLTTWQTATGRGRIDIGDYCLIGPGARIQAAEHITLREGVMLAANVLISDADWHDHYDRLSAPGKTAPVVLEDNCWIGERAIIAKGVRVGRNSIVGAGAVVVRDIPQDVIAAGNPARVIRPLDPDKALVTRAMLYGDPDAFDAQMRALYKLALRRNSLLGWLRFRFFPRQGD